MNKKNDFTELKIDTLKEAIKDFFDKRDANENIIPDIIITHTDNFFIARINYQKFNNTTRNTMLSTGVGGLDLMLKTLPSLDLVKIKYNGYILNSEEKEELLNLLQMENKYYTPDIEDIRVGYEYESFIKGYDGELDRWNKEIVSVTNPNLNFHLLLIDKYISKGEIRTPYLTKEQIKNEGWQITKSKYVLTKGDYKLTGLGFFPNKKLRISRGSLTIFYGECPSINEFRYICKLLKIN
jgi:hypothetical protein